MSLGSHRPKCGDTNFNIKAERKIENSLQSIVTFHVKKGEIKDKKFGPQQCKYFNIRIQKFISRSPGLP
jgi:CTP-dependent riboflavin kinase